MEDREKIKEVLKEIDDNLVADKKTITKHYDIMKRCVEAEKISVGKNALMNVNQCMNAMIIDYNENFSKKKLYKAIRCKDRFCPICQKIEARKMSFKLLICCRWIVQVKKKSLIFVTLTIPNCEDEVLRQTISNLIKSWAHMTRLKKIKKMLKGSYRKIEITYNKEKNNYHPHIHLMIAVNRSYFKNKEYVSHDEWKTLWQQSYENVTKIKMDQEPYVDVKRVYDEGAAFEITKYCAKPFAEFYEDEDVYATMRNAIKGKQLVAPRGLFAEAFELFENDELDYLMNEEEIKWVHRIRYEWDNPNEKYLHKALDIEEEVSREELAYVAGNNPIGRKIEIIDFNTKDDKKEE
jgi:plasmid rolling circle replication initiator protein Rep